MKKVINALCIVVMLTLVVIPLSISFADSVKSQQSPEVKGVEDKSIDERLKDAVALYIGSSQAIVNNIETQVDSTNANVKPYIKDGRTLVPVRFISESIGAEVDWDQQNSKVTVRLNNKVVELVIGNKTMKVGDKNEALDVAPEISEGRTYLPLRSLVEALGKKVFYDRGLIVISDREDIFDVSKDKGLIDEAISRVNNLPVVGSIENLKKILEKGRNHEFFSDIFSFDEIKTVYSKLGELDPIRKKIAHSPKRISWYCSLREMETNSVCSGQR